MKRYERKIVQIGDKVKVTLPHSEVMMHLNIAGQVHEVVVLGDGAQVLDESGNPFSVPVTHGEAGIYRDRAEMYVFDYGSGT